MAWFELLPPMIQALGAVTAAIVGAFVGHRLSKRQSDIYEHRINSDEDWFQDLIRSREIVFIGVSHSSLRVYLDQLMNHRPQSSRLHSIKVIYASNENGKMWEGCAFFDNLKESRQAVAALLCASEWRDTFREFDSVSFLQSKHVLSFGGTALDCKENVWRVLYVVHYLPTQIPDTKKTLTFRYAQYLPRFLPRKQHDLMNVYGDAYQSVLKRGENLGTFKSSLWDNSVQEWSKFSRSCEAHKNSMRHLLRTAGLRGNETVLDLASGTGDVSKIILDQYPEIKLTTLDASPRMIAKCREILGNRARFALSKVPPAPGESVIDIEGTSFDAVVIHLSIPAVASENDDLLLLARWCKNFIKEDAKVLLAIHNTAVHIDSNRFSIANDPLRRAIRDELKRMGKDHVYRNSPTSTCFQPSDVRTAFERAGYICVNTDQKVFPMTMRDRFLMWKSPAVLNTLVDVRKLTEDEIHTLISNVTKVVGDEPTPDMAVMYWSFAASPAEGHHETD